MNYVFTFNEINYGRVEIEAACRPYDSEIIENILEGRADYNNTDFTDFRLVEMDGKPHNDITEGSDTDNFICCLHDTPRDFCWCEENCARYYSCDTVAWAADESNEDKDDEGVGEGLRAFKVTITETLEKIVTVKARNRHEAEQMVSEDWHKSDPILDSDNFTGVDFKAVPADN